LRITCALAMGIRGKTSFGSGDLGFESERVKKNEPYLLRQTEI
jgi:hypothetical protein